jgi:hypothetical protein
MSRQVAHLTDTLISLVFRKRLEAPWLAERLIASQAFYSEIFCWISGFFVSLLPSLFCLFFLVRSSFSISAPVFQNTQNYNFAFGSVWV